ncbi:MAG: hypothetical protein K0R43_183, partial [Pseudoduganella sp.]|nr:hypothetical protein [Pseudoduganella sp.]
VTIDVLANDSDIDMGDGKTLSSVSQAASGASVSIVDGKIVYVANADAHDLLKEGDTASDSFTYTMKDSAGATSTATVTVTVTGVRDGQAIIGSNRSDGNLNGTAADELIDAGNGDDTLQGLDGADTLAGGNGNDILFGGQGIDTLYGNNGQDVLDGGMGDDQLYGGAGNDKFIIGAKAGKDTIWDFKPQNDVIQLNLQSASNFEALRQRASEVDGKVIFDLGDGASLTLVGVSLSALTSAHFHFAS